ncbi:DUF4330 domain-containing protein [Aneurinibacillus aneurinilyticus]|jgi:hypothetical protein|uniref:DUF4330 domain-containing protein n=2 Tax=Aneurinibacillus aneurinilyticus TaxID=1391 RepID=A0A848CXN2_ANEAE|nr:DUF4330 domain-containing protein [Aneurinibacillus aneurinilyticus]ERI09579.1 hypothetical protein HMPREF0083_02287 [Aneurinibacillus aneurinilyticus ATCC 12856]MCI1695299.1 DUF4330 domain-containing protein [Aneurinibacillus aneurinilyticus]MED0671075.1 DUF4330 domain-containing protein [Aneurinibacillus aneurinilyticus]MED0706948.1 DUF4330 domain-containing protein [Aneurinibacillus aneurinilyticus]MED0725069.1 DUF4330 domain-containing protein [Aneurinibacillus aneurinilyticus]
MKAIDQKGRVFGAINILDLFLILLLIGALVFAGIKFTQGQDVGTGPKTQKELTYVLYNSAEHPFVVNQIKKGDVLRNKDNNQKIGEVVSIDKQPGKVAVTTADGRMVMSTVPEKFSVFITVKTKGSTIGETAVGEDGSALLAGTKVSVKGPKYMIETLISEVNAGEK